MFSRKLYRGELGSTQLFFFSLSIFIVLILVDVDVGFTFHVHEKGKCSQSNFNLKKALFDLMVGIFVYEKDFSTHVSLEGYSNTL